MRCAIYCRLSKEDEEVGDKKVSESIKNQKEILAKYAYERGWEIFCVYVDEDYSGADKDRPEFRKMLRDAESGKFNIILCKTQSRFTRDIEIVEKYIHGLFLKWGIRFVAPADNIDTDISGNKKTRQINSLINEWYLEDLSENIRMVLDHKRKAGKYIGARPLYGYKKDEKDKNRLVVDEAAAKTVRLIFAWYLEGSGAETIAERLNLMCIPCPYEHKMKDHGGERKEVLWNKTAVLRILENEMYTGNMVQGKTRKISYKSKERINVPKESWIRFEHTHEPVIDEDTFRRVQKLRQSRRKVYKKSEKNILSGLVICGSCGGAMTKTTNGRGTAYFRCRKCGAGNSVRADVLEEEMKSRIERYVTAARGEKIGITRELVYLLAEKITVWIEKAGNAEREVTVTWRF